MCKVDKNIDRLSEMLYNNAVCYFLRNYGGGKFEKEQERFQLL